MTKKDMELEYTLYYPGKCGTKCPIDSSIGVYSVYCQKSCESYKGKHPTEQIIYCQKQGELTQKLKEKYVETVTKIMEDNHD